MLKRLSPVAFLLMILASAMSPAVASDELIWQPQDGEELSFNVTRNGQKFGYHRVKFERPDYETLKVSNEIRLRAGVGPITVYDYRHQSEEIWSHGRLASITGRTKKEGDNLTLFAEALNDILIVEGSGFDGEIAGDLVPSSHWNKRQVLSDAMLSSENGEVLDISVENLGAEQIEVQGEMINATRYSLASFLTVDLWYDEAGRWVRCAFSARGQNIVYTLEG